jgi:arsenite methyltransferase
MGFIQFTVFLGLASTLSACGSISKIDVWRTVTNGRDGWQHPAAVVEALAISPGDQVAEIGAGKGYWIPWLSRAVGPAGRVYAVEVESELVDRLRERVAEEQLDNVEVVFGEYTDPKLPDGQIDLAITALTYHHIDGRVDYFTHLQRDLSSNGRVAHLDDRDDLPRPIRWLPSKGHWSNVKAMNDEMDRAGYTQIESFDFLPLQSFQVFKPRTSMARSAPVRETAGH